MSLISFLLVAGVCQQAAAVGSEQLSIDRQLEQVLAVSWKTAEMDELAEIIRKDLEALRLQGPAHAVRSVEQPLRISLTGLARYEKAFLSEKYRGVLVAQQLLEMANDVQLARRLPWPDEDQVSARAQRFAKLVQQIDDDCSKASGERLHPDAAKYLSRSCNKKIVIWRDQNGAEAAKPLTEEDVAVVASLWQGTIDKATLYYADVDINEYSTDDASVMVDLVIAFGDRIREFFLKRTETIPVTGPNRSPYAERCKELAASLERQADQWEPEERRKRREDEEARKAQLDYETSPEYVKEQEERRRREFAEKYPPPQPVIRPLPEPPKDEADSIGTFRTGLLVVNIIVLLLIGYYALMKKR